MALVTRSARGYIHFPPPNLQQLCKKSSHIRVLAVKKHDADRGVLIYEVAETLKKGKSTKELSFKHAIPKDAAGVKPVLDWVADGKKAVMFTIESGAFAFGFVFIDKFCYSVDYNRRGDFWLLIRADPEMAATFHGTVETLEKVTRDILDGKQVKVPVDESMKPLSTKEREKLVPELNEILTRNRGE